MLDLSDIKTKKIIKSIMSVNVGYGTLTQDVGVSTRDRVYS